MPKQLPPDAKEGHRGKLGKGCVTSAHLPIHSCVSESDNDSSAAEAITGPTGWLTVLALPALPRQAQIQLAPGTHRRHFNSPNTSKM